jgi:predicted RNA polymerase sigma factor
MLLLDARRAARLDDEGDRPSRSASRIVRAGRRTGPPRGLALLEEAIGGGGRRREYQLQAAIAAITTARRERGQPTGADR